MDNILILKTKKQTTILNYLRIHSCLTFLIIDENGVIQKVINKMDEVISIMESEKFINKKQCAIETSKIIFSLQKIQQLFTYIVI